MSTERTAEKKMPETAQEAFDVFTGVWDRLHAVLQDVRWHGDMNRAAAVEVAISALGRAADEQGGPETGEALDRAGAGRVNAWFMEQDEKDRNGKPAAVDYDYGRYAGFCDALVESVTAALDDLCGERKTAPDGGEVYDTQAGVYCTIMNRLCEMRSVFRDFGFADALKTVETAMAALRGAAEENGERGTGEALRKAGALDIELELRNLDAEAMEFKYFDWGTGEYCDEVNAGYYDSDIDGYIEISRDLSDAALKAAGILCGTEV